MYKPNSGRKQENDTRQYALETTSQSQSATVDNEIATFFADIKTCDNNNGLDYWVQQEGKLPHLAPIAHS